ncbi:hypothetical protein SOVF_136960 isoform A [Spinacia oleracea]|uniref:Protein TPX2 isoform X2 n=1 Tax=Spinacia oleracea TaxID=3562 RepID=A0A9R0I424_SPIOL|nr:protein TPX2-like isoform X2 [Spinacia oleracea]KNA11245.1 hypothetical protein SOVF_136960 isoform A [Spinacia oleracea]
MDEVEEKGCVFEESFEIDFDYEFDVAKFFDFSQLETPEEIADSELWFNVAEGHPPSPLVAKLDTETDDFTDSVTSSPRSRPYSAYSIGNDSVVSEVSSIGQVKKGSQVLKLKLKSTSQLNFLVSSRLLQPTASLLAKKNQFIDVSTRVSRRPQKLGNTPMSPGDIDATKRQKLEIGYLRKASQLKHQTSFSHKSSKMAETTDLKSTHAKTKVTVPKEPDLATAHRALRQRFKNTPHLETDTKYNVSTPRARSSHGKIQETQYSKNKSTPPLPQFQDENVRGGKVANGSGMLDYKRTNSNKTLVQEKADLLSNFRAHPLNKKILSSKGDIGVFRNCKRETTVPREFKLSNSKKLSQNPPTELFSKLSLIPGNRTSSLDEQPIQIKVLKKNVSLPNIKENKNANAVTGKSTSCFGNGRRLITDIRNHLTNPRSFAIH